MDPFLIAASALLFVGILLTPVVLRTGAPFLLLFFAIGMLVGEDGPGGVHFDDFELAYDLGGTIWRCDGHPTTMRTTPSVWMRTDAGRE